MFSLVQKRRYYFIFSAIIMTLGIAVMLFSTIQTGSPFRLSIDFQGGSIYEFQFLEDGATESNIRTTFAENGLDNVVIQRLGGTDDSFIVAGDVAESDVVAAITAQTTGAVSTQDLPDTIYRFRFDEEAPSITQVRDEFPANVLIRARADADWSAVVPPNSLDDAEAAFEALNAIQPLTYEQVEGAIFALNVSSTISEVEVRETLISVGLSDVYVQRRPYRWSVRGAFADQQTNDAILDNLNTIAEVDPNSLRISTVSETVGREVTQAAFFAVVMACAVVTGFIVIAFRSVPSPVRYGVCAVVAMLHDVMIVLGVMSLMGIIAGWEIDALFLTAVLTVVGFSVQDTIVMFDRVRENIPKHLGEPYEAIVNRSVLETVHRSFGTQLSTFFVIITILLFGGETIRQFIAILFIGLVSGAYSSLFTAVPLLVAWEKGEIPFLKGDETMVAAQEAASS
ncbi:MAG: hypothetical protein EA396_13670 [Anaerolineaceae bacterium]|nr:MAG: hypothetical protein EA396_13670 [Anaerolineaceae bacterium]